MKKIKFVFVTIGLFISLISCRQTPNPELKQDATQKHERYISIDGLWRVTQETAIKYPHGTLEPVIYLTGEAGDKLSARGCFLWENRFYDYWTFDSVRFINADNQLLIFNNEGGTYKAVVDKKKEFIRGTVCWGDEEDTNKLDFARACDLNSDKFFTPYPPAPDGSIKYTYYVPEAYTEQLQTASIFEFVNDTTAFYDLIERIIRQEFGRLESFLIIKDQKLVLEEYFYGYNRTQLHPIHSCTKSIISVLLGIALERHKTIDVNKPVFDFFPEYNPIKTPEKESITLKHVLTMTSGLPDEDDFEIHDPDDLVKQLLNQPLVTVPGEKFKYNNNGTNLLGCIIYTLENKQADEFARDVLFNKLGIVDFYWEKENGVLHCHSDLQMRPADMAKIGLLVLNNGYWNGESIVPKEWIEMSTKPHAAESEFFDYGYQWWYRSKKNKSWWNNPIAGSKDEHDMFLALGYGGQFIMVVRDLNMVIVTTSSDYNEETGMAHQKVPMVIEDVVPIFDKY